MSEQQTNQNLLDPKNWVNNYADYLYRFAYFRVNKQELAEDLVQDTFLAGIKGQHTYSGLASEKTWLVSILKNKIIDHYKKASTKNESPLNINNNDAIDYNHFFDQQKMNHWQKQAMPKDWEQASDKNIETQEFYSILENCLEKLPVKWKGIFTMSLLDEQDAKLICKEFDISSSNFWVIMHRAKLQIRECLEKNWIKI